jgi:hypothetical protein
MNMPLVLLNRRRRGTGFNPASLFGLNEQGVWYDPSDLSTLFTDTAGTTPVTTPGQTVALMLDKSRGLALGAEAVTNGSFATDTDWTKGTGWTISGGVASCDGTAQFSQLSQANVTPLAKYFKVSFTLVSKGASVTSLRVVLGGNFVGEFALSSAGTYSGYFFNSGGSLTFALQTQAGTGAAFAISIDNISVRELQGNHATQATAASRPTYGVVPLGGRRNQVLWSEDFSNAVWTKDSCTVVANTTLAPDGTTTADRIVSAAATTQIGVGQGFPTTPTATAHTASYYVQANGARYVQLLWSTGLSTNYANFDLQNPTAPTAGTYTAATITAAANGFYRITITSTLAAAAGGSFLWFVDSGTAARAAAYTGNGTSGIFIWGAQLEQSATATPYQRITTAFDVTEAGVQSLSYLSFDGVDDSMATGTITPGVNKAQVFAGVRKLSDALESMLLEFSVNSNTNNGSFQILGPDSSATSTYRFYARGDTANTGYVPTGYAAPITNVIASLMDLAGADRATEVIPRINGVLAQVGAAGSGAAGGGNFLAYPLYLGRRAGTSLPASMSLFGLITRFGANLDTTAITDTETWVNGKTGAYA